MNELYQKTNQNNPLAMLNDIKNNPAQFLAEKGNINLPPNVNVNNSEEVLRYCLSTKNVPQFFLNQVYNKAFNVLNMIKR